MTLNCFCLYHRGVSDKFMLVTNLIAADYQCVSGLFLRRAFIRNREPKPKSFALQARKFLSNSKGACTHSLLLLIVKINYSRLELKCGFKAHLILMPFYRNGSGEKKRKVPHPVRFRKKSCICREQRVREQRMLVWKGESLLFASQVSQINSDDQDRCSW